ncbi:hypothetical protein Lal_00031464 [Lupinus albus]|nr:hypothetical protein Lal_00031464 [Lupinus albus]
MESKDLNSMALATLFGKLQEHEMELECLTLHEESYKRKKGISLKASTSQDQEEGDEEDSDSDIDNETMTLLRKGSIKRFQKRESRNPTFKGKNPKD